MDTQPTPSSPSALLQEADARMTQALAYFFQRNHGRIQAAVARAVESAAVDEDNEPADLASCVDRFNHCPDALSSAFAQQFHHHLIQPETFNARYADRPAELQVTDDATLARQLAEEKVAHDLVEALRGEMLLLFARVRTVRRAAMEDEAHCTAYGALPVVRALSRALDGVGIDSTCGTVLLHCAASALHDTLRQTYTALNQFLGAQDIPALSDPAAVPLPATSPPELHAGAGQDILTHIRAAARTARAATGGMKDTAPPLRDQLPDWEAHAELIEAPNDVMLLRRLHTDVQESAPAFDLALLDVTASFFETLLAEPGISPPYRTELAKLQLPIVKLALADSTFFTAPDHPARRVIDLIALFARRFPESTADHLAPLEKIGASTRPLTSGTPGVDVFDLACLALSAWLAAKNAARDRMLADEIARLQGIERQALGTLLARETLRDLAVRFPAPVSVLHRLESAWVPFMSSLYVAESGEGPEWRAASQTLRQLFLSLQAPPDADREVQLKSIPVVNAALRRGLLSQGAEPSQLKDFFGAITLAQERWIRPDIASRVSAEEADGAVPVADALGAPPAEPVADSALPRACSLTKGDWVDFRSPHENRNSAEIVWVGIQGTLLLVDATENTSFSVNCTELARDLRQGHASIPERSLTCRALQHLRIRLGTTPT